MRMWIQEFLKLFVKLQNTVDGQESSSLHPHWIPSLSFLCLQVVSQVAYSLSPFIPLPLCLIMFLAHYITTWAYGA